MNDSIQILLDYLLNSGEFTYYGFIQWDKTKCVVFEPNYTQEQLLRDYGQVFWGNDKIVWDATNDRFLDFGHFTRAQIMYSMYQFWRWEDSEVAKAESQGC